MWAVRAGVHFLVQLGIAVVIGLVVGALWAVVQGGGFLHAISVGFMVVGVLMLLLGCAGQSSADRVLETGGRIPGVRAYSLQAKPGDISVRPGALLILAGLVLIGIGVVLRG